KPPKSRHPPLPGRARPVQQGPDLLEERVAVEALELPPRAQGPGIGDPIDEEDAAQVVDLVLKGRRGETVDDAVDAGPMTIERADPQAHEALDEAAQVRHRQAALVALEALVADRLELGV